MRIPLVLAIITLVFSVLIDLGIYRDLRKNLRHPRWEGIYMLVSVVLWIIFIVIYFLPKRSESSGIIYLMWMLYAYLSVYLGKIVYLLISWIGSIVNGISGKKPRRHPAMVLGTVAGVGVVAVMILGVVFTRRHIVVERVEISSPNLPPQFNGFRLVQLSDLHVGTWGDDTSFLSALVDSVNSLKPDLIVFTGDIVNRKTDELLPFVRTLSGLKARYGVMSVLGNHDYGDYVDWGSPAERAANNALLANLELEMGWDLLNNTRRTVSRGSDSIMIVGVENWGEPPFPTYGDLSVALSPSSDSTYNQNDGRFKILLTHNPEHWNRYVADNTDFDLTLSGHTHAMQAMVRIGDFKWSPAMWRYPQWRGLYERTNRSGKKTRLYVNIGAGEVGMPARLLSAYPEITLITLRRDAAPAGAEP